MVRDGKSLEEVRTLEDSLGREHPDWQGRIFLTRGIQVIYQSLADQSR
jgi:hypothetical protein